MVRRRRGLNASEQRHPVELAFFVPRSSSLPHLHVFGHCALTGSFHTTIMLWEPRLKNRVQVKERELVLERKIDTYLPNVRLSSKEGSPGIAVLLFYVVQQRHSLQR